MTGFLSLVDAGQIAGSVVAIVTALGALSRLRPVKWVWRRLVSEPAKGWTDRQFAQHLDPIRSDVSFIKGELSFNGGQSVKDRVARIDRDVAEIKERL